MVRMRKGGGVSSLRPAEPHTNLPTSSGGNTAFSSRSTMPLSRLLRHPPSLLICGSLVMVALWVGLNVHSMTLFHAHGRRHSSHRGGPDSVQIRRDNSVEAPSHGLTREQVLMDVMHGRVTLVELAIPLGALSDGTEHESYYGVTGKFCRVRWDIYKQDPAKTPMFKDLLKASPDCKSTRYLKSMDIDMVVKHVRAFDERQQQNQVDIVHSMELAGVVAHESRCGSTLAANLVTAANPEGHRMYSEAPPPSTIFKRCEADTHCDWDKATTLLQDVLYLMGRSSSSKERRVFYKLQMSGSRSLWIWRRAMQEQQQKLKWVYIFRESVQALMSHYKGADDFERAKKSKSACLRIMQRPPKLLKDTAEEYQKSLKGMSNTEACAVHLSALNQAAMTEHEEHGEGHFVEYSSLPTAVWEYILPDVFDVPVDDAGLQRMKQISGVYSKIHGGKMVGKEWKEDSAKKVESAPDSVQRAAATYMSKSYSKLQELAWKHSTGEAGSEEKASSEEASSEDTTSTDEESPEETSTEKIDRVESVRSSSKV